MTASDTAGGEQDNRTLPCPSIGVASYELAVVFARGHLLLLIASWSVPCLALLSAHRLIFIMDVFADQHNDDSANPVPA